MGKTAITCERCGKPRRTSTTLEDDTLNGGKGGLIRVCLACAKKLLPYKGVSYVDGTFPVMRGAS